MALILNSLGKRKLNNNITTIFNQLRNHKLFKFKKECNDIAERKINMCSCIQVFQSEKYGSSFNL